ncbi:MAG TPA: RNA ligase family protein [Clostridiaceae bacterium]|nr:RNA ligase family protein [Clostridiaceae bacterium]
MIKKTLYPKTKRIQYKNRVVITEKLDGSNIGFFKVNGDLIIAQNNNVNKYVRMKNGQLQAHHE